MVRIERHSHVVIWTIDRPEAKNALDHATIGELADAIDEANRDNAIRAAILTGAGHTFAAGGDLRELRNRNSPQDAERFSEMGFHLCRAITELPFPVVCALSGPAIGGGAELALACDLRIADVRATIGFRQVRLGVTTAWGTVPRLLALVGMGAAARLLYAGHDVNATEAKLLGLVDEVTENGLARTQAIAWAQDVAQGSPKAIADMKRLMRESSAAVDDVRALEKQLFVDTFSGPDHAEAVEAYFARRAPRWHDR